jgi:hypothetical protein
MKPSKIHDFFAEDRPALIGMRTGRILGMVPSARYSPIFRTTRKRALPLIMRS